MNSAFLRLMDRIAQFQKANPGSEVWISAKNMDTGGHFALGENQKVRTASTIKLPILCAVYQGVAEGQWKLTDKLVLRDVDKVSGSGIIREFDESDPGPHHRRLRQ
jgi:beta-lactamase class A